ncbi:MULTISPECIES: IS30 family transposase [unclassified Caballeronia]|uniref:IS30 family transposase n=1 Tax=unclassified Caballeronia TaxID=2646786 RepID=UPI0028604033|nr:MULTISPECIES: IS30 family transposase [unclassified Caballeronia]MDR5777506.1 IS30 family transposase [Caballeronia sp. LZ002]MDR5798575.1 IS30 family transposase [Caballeronia sp. LZ001]MDR5852954.1 IS30 family transposase [Caballeronia sp. LZ003]
MNQKRRCGLSPAQKTLLWQRWKDGESLSDIGRSLGKHAASIHAIVRPHGGIMPMMRKRSTRVLTLAEREEISRGVHADVSIRQIAASLGRSPSTISREVARHGGLNNYRAALADASAWDRAKRPKRCRLAVNAKLRRLVARKLQLKWAPQQIAGWLKQQYPDDESMQVSHETIYRSLFIQTRGVLKAELMKHLRTRRMMRRSKKASAKGQPRGQIIDAVSIRERPAEAEDRAVPGHWEGDLLSGSNNTHIATLVERYSRFTILVKVKVKGKDTESVVSALSKQVRKLPVELRRSVTWDRGMELAKHKQFTVATDVQVYFCDPQSPWQRGTNENTNGLLRQYFPKGTSLAGYSQGDLNRIALELNQRPRKTLGFMTPADKLDASMGVAFTN